MKSFLSEYGTALFTMIVITLLIMMASPVSTKIYTATSSAVANFATITSGTGSGDGMLSNASDTLDKTVDIIAPAKRTEDGDITSGNDTEGKDTGDIGDLGL